MPANRRWRFLALAALFLVQARTVRPDTPAADTPAATLVRQGRDLLQRGEILAAKRRFEEAFRLSADAEALFMVAQCWERLGNDDEAERRYRQYQQLPLALRTAEAESCIRAIAQRKRNASDTAANERPRYILVPVGTDRGACAERCTSAEVCRSLGRKGSGWDTCLANQFACLRACPGAQVSRGTCPRVSSQEHTRRYQDNRPIFGAGWVTPARY
ncbi:MAG: hypothetical protein WCG85_20085 [Polyangia bacterium]